MRKSVARKLLEAENKKSAHKRRFRSHWRLTLMIVLTLATVDIAVIGGLQAYTTLSTADSRAAQAKQIAATQKVIDATRKHDADARAQEAKAAAAYSDIKAEYEEGAKTNPEGADSTVTCDVTNPSSVTAILNKKHCFSPIDWEPASLTLVDGIQMQTVAAQHMQAMRTAAAKAGLPFELTSGYRSYASQQATYASWVAVNGSAAAADTVSARPGFSEHQTGLAADLSAGGCVLECFATTAQYTWLVQHAAEYGFIQRYPDKLTVITGYLPEPWHWRYVGSDVATLMKAKHIQTLEVYYGVTGGNYAD